MKALSYLGTFAAGVLLSGCGEYLGEYEVEHVRLASRLSAHFGENAQSYGQYIQIDLASATSLSAIGDKLDGVYVEASFCPMKDSSTIIAFGPDSQQGDDLSVPALADAQVASDDGAYHYRVYLVPAHPMPGVRYSTGMQRRPRYDIRKSHEDVCLRLFSPGYNLVASRSDVVRIPAEMIAHAIDQPPADDG